MGADTEDRRQKVEDQGARGPRGPRQEIPPKKPKNAALLQPVAKKACNLTEPLA